MMKKILIRSFIVILILCLLSACSISSREEYGSSTSSDTAGRAMQGYAGEAAIYSEAEYSKVAPDVAYGYDMDMSTELAYAADGKDIAQSEPVSNTSFPPVATQDRKIIREQFIEQHVQNLKEILSEIDRTIVRMSGAYIESLHEWKVEERNKTEFRAQLILRIPQGDYPEFLEQMEKQGNILRRSQSGYDVTEEYVDNESRLRNLTAHEERILQLYEKAETIEDMLKIENELSRIRSSIEQFEGRQKYLSHVTSSVRLVMELVEVQEEELLTGQEGTPLWTQAWIHFKQSLKHISELSEKAFIFVFSSIPYLAILAVGGVILFLIVRRLLRFKKEATPSKED